MTVTEIRPAEKAASELADSLVAELQDYAGRVPGGWARKAVPGDFYREGGAVTFTLEPPTRVFGCRWFVLRDDDVVLDRSDVLVILRWNEAEAGHPAMGDSLEITYPGLAP